jgi:AcrR family transcriptional regulator
VTSEPIPRRGRGRPRGPNASSGTRERIVAAAAHLFAERGYHATPMSAVADAAGLSQTGVVHHFPDKAELLAAVLERRDVRDVAGLSARRGRAPRGWEVLDDMVELVRLNAGRAGIVRLYTSLAGEAVDPAHPGHPWLRHHLDDAVTTIESALRQAVEDGEADEQVPATAIARQLVALMDGLQVQWLMTPDEVDMAGAVAAHVDTVRERWGRRATGE